MKLGCILTSVVQVDCEPNELLIILVIHNNKTTIIVNQMGYQSQGCRIFMSKLYYAPTESNRA